MAPDRQPVSLGRVHVQSQFWSGNNRVRIEPARMSKISAPRIIWCHDIYCRTTQLKCWHLTCVFILYIITVLPLGFDAQCQSYSFLNISWDTTRFERGYITGFERGAIDPWDVKMFVTEYRRTQVVYPWNVARSESRFPRSRIRYLKDTSTRLWIVLLNQQCWSHKKKESIIPVRSKRALHEYILALLRQRNGQVTVLFKGSAYFRVILRTAMSKTVKKL